MLILIFQLLFAILYVASVVGYKHHIKGFIIANSKKEKVYEGDVGYYILAAFWPIVGLFNLAYDGYKSIRK